MEAKDRWALLQEREWQVYFGPNEVGEGTTNRQFVDDFVAHHKHTWSQYQIPVVQVNAVLAQLMLLHQCVRCVVDPEFYGDDVEEGIRMCITSCNGVM